MAKERVDTYRNTGSDSAPNWEQYFIKTLADCVRMGEDNPKTIQEYVDEAKAKTIEAAQQYADGKITELVGGADTQYDTLEKLASAIKENDNVLETLQSALDSKADDTDLKYTNTTPVVQAHGGIAAGETFDGVPLTEMITKMLYPYVAPTVTAATTPTGGVFECGTTKSVTAVTATIKKGSEDITKVEAFNGTSSIGSSTTVSTVNSTGSGNVAVTVSADIKTNSTLKVTVTDKQNKQTSANATAFTFVYPYYQGVIAADAEADETAVKALTKIVQAKGTKPVTYTAANQKMVFATPKSYGVIKTITDPNSFNVTGTFTQTEVSITGLDGKPQDYYVYTSNPTTVSAFKMTFAY